MQAAVVHEFAQGPKYGSFADPAANANEDEVLLTVKAAALSNLVRGQTSGRHYSSEGTLPFVPGNDGVGVTAAGDRVYFIGPRSPWGSMAETTVVSRRRTIAIPEGVADVAAAALGNPALASWGALIGRAKLESGEVVLVNGATGTAGRQAIQAARLLGASRIIATGRDEAALEALRSQGVEETISLKLPDDALSVAFKKALGGGVNVVLDYLWGHSAETLLQAAAGRGSIRGEPRIRYVQIGAISGDPIALSGGILRSSGLELVGSGLGSLSAAAMLQALGRAFKAAGEGLIQIETETMPLAEVALGWSRSTGSRRLVFVP